ncbi:hypothetical protein IE53DRAFT_383516 [Violaceomyces palustris]|uniref:Uncharacterized protein n=1 Tax=Violaceomyces palustris TaxID=1673888 RepID=A0ACD0P7F1_9BASI|nr:hypothetical protein IE53DRAFT_383516 [Violaceomyces palustris]
MKFGKTYMETIADPSFPKEWRQGAIEYKYLKKLINGVVAELESLGLGADVLRELLVPPGEEAQESVKLDLDVMEQLHQVFYHASSENHPSLLSSSSSATSKIPRSRSSSQEDHLSSDAASSSYGHSREATKMDELLEPVSEREEEEQVDERNCDMCRQVGTSRLPSDGAGSDEASIERSAQGSTMNPLHHRHVRKVRHLQRGRDLSVRSASQSKSRSASRGDASDQAAATTIASESMQGMLNERGAGSMRRSSSENQADPRFSPRFKELDSDGRRPPRYPKRDHLIYDQITRPASTDGAKWSGIGKKDLEAWRSRNSAVDGATAASSSSLSSSFEGSAKVRKSEPSPGRHDWGAMHWREVARPNWNEDLEANAGSGREKVAWDAAQSPNLADEMRKTKQKGERMRWVQGKGGRRARAEYELGGTPEHPIPRIRLFIESPIHSDSEDGSEDESGSVGSDGGESADRVVATKVDRLEAISHRVGSPSPSSLSSAATVRAENDGDPSESKTAAATAPLPPTDIKKIRTREVVIPLTADTEFLDTLTGALSNLSNLQTSQRETFIAETESLCSAVARVASPYATKSDLYVWREIFSLWMDHQIFESQREKDRGELSIDESETRLKRFADEMAKRGWMMQSTSGSDPSGGGAGGGGGGIKGRLIKRKTSAVASSNGLQDGRSLAALEDFMRLNVALLDVKKFQRVNVEAARKILKKHDKRTALTASSDLRAFMAQQEEARRWGGGLGGGAGVAGQATQLDLSGLDLRDVGSSSKPRWSARDDRLANSVGALSSSMAHPSLAALLPSSTTGLLSESLPHILLSLLTTTLLPILPSLDDYSCAICTSVAWRPIRLDCSHLFCIRCLVKLQKKGKADCPLCRCPGVVANADGRNMDESTVNFLKAWFPKEVGEKDRENEAERRKEEMAEMGLLEHERCLIC